jgi:hypothetical protein
MIGAGATPKNGVRRVDRSLVDLGESLGPSWQGDHQELAERPTATKPQLK